ncbi:MAG: MFS transporter [Tepidanaerobacteraceae bacterium]|nr:MFS transporter [Tepidanaerobacteraceae bacterium]
MISLDKYTKTSNQQATIDKLTRYLYILPSLGTSAPMSYFSSYLPMLFTDIYMMPVALSGALETIRALIAWFAGPSFGIFLDRVTTRIGKYWIWIVVGVLGSNVANIITFALPSISESPQNLALLVFLLGIIASANESISATAIVGFYPRLATDPKGRSFLAISQKVGRDGGKTLWGLIVPGLLVYFIAKGGSEAAGWAATAYVIGIFAIALNFIYAFILKSSFIEREAIAAKGEIQAKKKRQVPLSTILKGVVMNKALLTVFLFLSIHKIYYFFQLLTASYFFKYVANNFSALGTYMLLYNLSAVVGAMFGVVWLKIFKDSKRSFIAAGMVHIAVLGVLRLFFTNFSTGAFIALVAVASFFAGVIEAYLMPMFAAAADWALWKTGERTDAITMAVYSLSVRVGLTLSTLIRTSILAVAGYNGAAYAKGAVPTQKVINTLINLQSLYPFLLAVIAFAIVLIFYPLNDKKIAKIKEEIDAGRVGSLANEKVLTEV